MELVKLFMIQEAYLILNIAVQTTFTVHYIFSFLLVLMIQYNNNFYHKHTIKSGSHTERKYNGWDEKNQPYIF